MGYVYLIHFEKPVNGMRHYTGYTDDFEKRIAEHRSNKGSNLTRAASEQGINWLVVRVWQQATLETEQSIKGMSTKITCPICRQKEADKKKRAKDVERQVSIANMQARRSIKENRANLS
jgi:predicted GIY-YIG superfamily endonuclease